MGKTIIMLVIFIWARISQLLGNIAKIIFIIHFKLFPDKRFRLPSESAPLLKSEHKGVIAPILWQTNYTSDVTLSLYVNYWWNRLMAPTYSYRFLDDSACLEYVRLNYPESVLNSYERLQVGAAKADFWRVLAVLKEGGVYMDLDAALCWPPGYFFRNGERELLLRMGDGRLTNYCFAAVGGHPLLQKISELIQHNIATNSHDCVFGMTGPWVFQQFDDNDSLNIISSRYVSRQGQFTNKSLQYPKRPDMYWVNQEKEISILKDAVHDQDSNSGK